MLAFAVGYLVVKNQPLASASDHGLGSIWKKVDFLGSLLLVTAVSVQLVGLSLGGNELPWGSPWVIGSLLGSLVLFALFLWVEATTKAIPVIPLRLLKGRLPVATQVTNVCAGMAAYGVSTLHIISPWHRLTLRPVPVYASSLLPGGIARLCHQGWSATCYPFVGDPDWRCHRRRSHVALGKVAPSRANWSDPNGFWKCPRYVSWV